VARTQPRHEKHVALQLDGRGIDHFLPLYETISQWKDRRARVQLPLFPGYVFVFLPYCERLQALRVPSLIEFVSFAGKPAPVDSEEIDILRRGLNSDGVATPHTYLRKGQRVLVTAGPFTGLTGIISRKQGQSRLVVSIDSIQRSIAIHLDGATVEPLSRSRYNC
jgi:transcription antitermination factor NusG